ncbi:MAG: hypothetical protein BWY74_01921 [Firmicutes bacterium ADurb.Bin419]|nr:MAG: hypothetical protein BWY74_01921 [Firmicutes bacterium ADurb.Bin419]
MKTKKIRQLTIFLLSLPLCITTLAGCEKNGKSEYSVGQIIEITCGGTVIKFLANEKIGEDWVDNFSSPVLSYANCVLVGNLSEENYKKGDTIYFDYLEVDTFKNGNFCDIGGLPTIKIEISQLLTK